MRITNVRITEPFPPWHVPIFGVNWVDEDGYYTWTAYRIWRLEIVIRRRRLF